MAELELESGGYVRSRTSRIFGYVILIVVALILMAPIFFLTVNSVKAEEEYMKYPIKVFAEEPVWPNYEDIFVLTPFLPIAARTAALAIGVVILNCLSSSLIGFAFARYRDVKFNAPLFSIVIALLIVPGIVVIIPQFIVYAKLRLTNTYWPWILGAIGGSPFYIFLFRQFFMGFPKELEEAAEIDGCSPFRIYWGIFLPNAKAAMATVGIFSFIGVWSDYFMPLIYLNDSKTLLGKAMATAFKNPQGFTINTVSLAAAVLYILPLLMIFFLFQKYILKGVVTSGIKG
ncbi:MAG: carbohydrate ABC transporter permease [Anaerolineaceae bacterium]|nr:carbohydrate ABC transporter permease [Anaerolineaceae bacterium]